MNPTLLLRLLGIGAITSAGISFLLEGWNELNGLEKYLGFYGLVIIQFILAEFFKETEKTISKVFAALTLTTAPVLMIQLGAFLLDPTDARMIPSWVPQMTLPKDAPIKFVILGSIFTYGTLIFRSLTLFKSTYPRESAILILTTSFLFLIPLRTDPFHGGVCFLLVIFVMIFYRRFDFEETTKPLSQLICLTAPLYFFARSCLYQVDDFMMVTIYFILSLVTFRILPQFSDLKNHVKFFHALGYFFSILGVFKFLNMLPALDMTHKIFINEMILIVIIYRHAQSQGVGFFQLNFLAWSHCLIFFINKQYLSISEILISLAIPALMLCSSYLMKEKSSFYQSLLMLTLTTVLTLMKIIVFPVVNLWIVFASLGILLISLSSFVGRIPDKISEIKNRLTKIFDKNDE